MIGPIPVEPLFGSERERERVAPSALCRPSSLSLSQRHTDTHTDTHTHRVWTHPDTDTDTETDKHRVWGSHHGDRRATAVHPGRVSVRPIPDEPRLRPPLGPVWECKGVTTLLRQFVGSQGDRCSRIRESRPPYKGAGDMRRRISDEARLRSSLRPAERERLESL